jgi:hypothetical protein
MKCYEFKIGSDLIEFRNSLFGIEKVFVNKKRISIKQSFKGAHHFFHLNSNQYLLKTNCKIVSGSKMNIRLFKNGQLIDYKSVSKGMKISGF